MDSDATHLRACLELTETLVRERTLPAAKVLRTVSQKHSMLHVDVLLLLHHFAQVCQGQILEIGPYVGGSTIALALGARTSAIQPKKVTSVEPGGQLQDYTHVPSSDILRDLRLNLVLRGVADLVTIIEGYAGSEPVAAALRQRFKPGEIGLLFVDADGDVERDLRMCGDLLGAGCFLVVDDYCGESNKTLSTRAQIDEFVARGILQPLGVYGWGTWVGRLLNSLTGIQVGKQTRCSL